MTGGSECGQMAALQWYANANANSHGNRNGYCNAYSNFNTQCNRNSYRVAYTDTNRYGYSNSYSQSNTQHHSHAERMCSGTGLLEEPYAVAGQSIATWQSQLQPAGVAIHSSTTSARQCAGSVGSSGNRCKAKHCSRCGWKLCGTDISGV